MSALKVRTATTATAAATAVMACALVSVAAGAATAAGPTGCPAGYELMSVGVLQDRGYQVPGQVDDPTSGIRSFGSAGNGDGWVCAVQLGNRTTPWGDPVYNFWDNTLRA